MKFSLILDPDVAETTVQVTTPEITDEVLRLEAFVRHHGLLDRIVGMHGSQATVLAIADVSRFYTANKSVYAQVGETSWRMRLRLKDLEEKLPRRDFIRINHGEIVNVSWVARMDLTLAGTIGLTLKDGTRCFVSRRALKEFRRVLGL